MFDFETSLSNAIIKRIEQSKVICWNNGKPQSLKIVKGQYTSWQVPEFMTKISYPSNPDRDYGITVYIHFIEYEIKKRIQNRKLEIKSFEDYERIYEGVLADFNFGTECQRFYDSWLRRKDFESARLSGRL